MAQAVDRNRLADEHSPYLQQHADNPVHWQPWDEAALSAARERDVPIFLSVGYAACHWCHVMEGESFQDEAIASVLNEHFVPIKVDREERPDLDRIYQTVCQLVSGSGGWPLSVWLTPDGRPFYVGTYFPPTEARGQPGFRSLLGQIHESWETDRGAIEERADQWVEAARDQLEVTDPGVPGTTADEDDDVLERTAQATLRGADRVHGGFGQGGPKFPQPRRLDLLIHAAARTGRETYRTVAGEALDAMADRGLYDHVGGGFHRYATDRSWSVPHFEKMLYDNAELPRVYLAGYQLTGDERYATVARETFDFVTRELQHPDGGFYSTLDAQSEGREGAFYVWTPAEIQEAVEDEKTAELFCERYGITEDGNFEEGTSVLARSRSLEELADEAELSTEEVADRLDAARQAVFAARTDRERPRRDEKVLAGWNGLMISAMAEGGLVLDDRHLAAAEDALEFVRETHWDAETGRLRRRYLDGTVGVEGYLDDYAYLARGALDVYQASGEFEPLSFAVELARTMVSEFWDADAGTLYFTPESGEPLVTRPQDLPDQSLPSSLGVALEVLTMLSPFSPDEAFEEVVETTLATHAARIDSSPTQHATLALVRDLVRSGGLEVTLVGDSLPPEWGAFIAESYLPGRLLARRPPEADTLATWVDRLGLDETPPIWQGRTREGDEPTVYLCREFTCSPPLTDVNEAREWVDRLSPAAESA